MGYSPGGRKESDMIEQLHFHFSVIISEVVHLFMCFWPSVCLLWRNVYLDLSPIVLIGLFVFLKKHISYMDLDGIRVGDLDVGVAVLNGSKNPVNK